MLLGTNILVNLSSKIILKEMSGFDIVTVIAVILFARLGVRLLIKYREIKNNDDNSSEMES